MATLAAWWAFFVWALGVNAQTEKGEAFFHIGPMHSALFPTFVFSPMDSWSGTSRFEGGRFVSKNVMVGGRLGMGLNAFGGGGFGGGVDIGPWVQVHLPRSFFVEAYPAFVSPTFSAPGGRLTLGGGWVWRPEPEVSVELALRNATGYGNLYDFDANFSRVWRWFNNLTFHMTMRGRLDPAARPSKGERDKVLKTPFHRGKNAVAVAVGLDFGTLLAPPKEIATGGWGGGKETRRPDRWVGIYYHLQARRYVANRLAIGAEFDLVNIHVASESKWNDGPWAVSHNNRLYWAAFLPLRYSLPLFRGWGMFFSSGVGATVERFYSKDVSRNGETRFTERVTPSLSAQFRMGFSFFVNPKFAFEPEFGNAIYISQRNVMDGGGVTDGHFYQLSPGGVFKMSAVYYFGQ